MTTNKELERLTQGKGNLKISNRNFSGDYQFGDAFLYQDSEDKFLLLAVSKGDQPYISFLPIAVSEIEDFNEASISKLNVDYHTRKPSFSETLLQKILGGQIPIGSFDFFISKDDEAINDFQKQVSYVGTLNLDELKIQNYGGTSYITGQPLKDAIKHCLGFGGLKLPAHGSQVSVKIQLEQLCKI